MLDIMSPTMPCLELHVYACSMLLHLCPCQSHACMLGFVFSHAFMFVSTCLYVYPHAYMRISMFIYVDRCVYMLRSMFSTCFMPSSMCLHASRHVSLVVMSCAIVAHLFLLSHFLVFWPNG